MQIKRFDHVSFTVADLDASIDFYERLGFVPDKRYLSAGDDAAEGTDTEGAEIDIGWMRHPVGGPLLEFLRYGGQPTGRSAHNSRVGAAHICLAVEDVSAEVTRLEGAGVEFVSPPHTDDFGLTWVYMRDVDGNVVELISDPQ